MFGPHIGVVRQQQLGPVWGLLGREVGPEKPDPSRSKAGMESCKSVLGVGLVLTCLKEFWFLLTLGKRRAEKVSKIKITMWQNLNLSTKKRLSPMPKYKTIAYEIFAVCFAYANVILLKRDTIYILHNYHSLNNHLRLL